MFSLIVQDVVYKRKVGLMDREWDKSTFYYEKKSGLCRKKWENKNY
jgi:hypothetical protein